MIYYDSQKVHGDVLLIRKGNIGDFTSHENWNLFVTLVTFRLISPLTKQCLFFRLKHLQMGTCDDLCQDRMVGCLVKRILPAKI